MYEVLKVEMETWRCLLRFAAIFLDNVRPAES